MYDPRLGKFLSIDPMTKTFTGQSPYSYAMNSPILFYDKEGEHPAIYIAYEGFVVLLEVVLAYIVIDNVYDNIPALNTGAYNINSSDPGWRRRQERAAEEQAGAVAAAAIILQGRLADHANPGGRDPNQNLDPNGNKGRIGAFVLGAIALFKEAVDLLDDKQRDIQNQRNQILDKLEGVRGNDEIDIKDRVRINRGLYKDLDKANSKLKDVKLAKFSLNNKIVAEFETQKRNAKNNQTSKRETKDGIQIMQRDNTIPKDNTTSRE